MLHRWVGLAIALFLIVVGLTGATIAWNDELEAVFAPALFVLPPAPTARPPLDPFALREAAARAMPGFAIDSVDFTRRADQPARFFVEARPGGPDPRETEIALDPVTGKIIAARRAGDLREGLVNLMPFIYDLHDALAAGDRGIMILGIVGLLWTIDCFIGAYLTLPVRARMRRSPGRWLANWRGAWTIRTQPAPFKLAFDLHRAGGLWLWGLLFCFAWSSVAFNLPVVYRSVTCVVLPCASVPETAPAARSGDPLLGWRAAYAVAHDAMAQASRRAHFAICSERLMFYRPATHVYSYRVRSSRDPAKLGNTQLNIDGDTGRLLSLSLPTGKASGDTFTTWIEAIHEAGVFGLAMKVVVTIAGLSVAMLSVTGILLYARKARARRYRAAG